MSTSIRVTKDGDDDDDDDENKRGGGPARGGPARGGPAAKVTLTSLPPELLVRITLWLLWDSATATLVSPPEERISKALHMVGAVSTYFRAVVFQTGIRWNKSFTTLGALAQEYPTRKDCTTPMPFSTLVRGGFPPLSINVREIFDTLDMDPWVIPDAVVIALQTLVLRTGREVRVSFTLMTRQSAPTLLVLAFRVVPDPGDPQKISVVFFPEALSVGACERCGQRLSDPWVGTRQCESTRTCRLCPVCTGPSPQKLMLCKNPGCLCGGKLKLCPKHIQGCSHGCEGVYVTPHAKADNPLSASQLHRCDADVCTALVCDAPDHVPVPDLRASEWICKGKDKQGKKPQRLCPQHLARCATCKNRGYAPLMKECGSAACDEQVCKSCQKYCEACRCVVCKTCAADAQDGAVAALILCKECNLCIMPTCNERAATLVTCIGCGHGVPICAMHTVDHAAAQHLVVSCVRCPSLVEGQVVWCAACADSNLYGQIVQELFVCKRHRKVCQSCFEFTYTGQACFWCTDSQSVRCDTCVRHCSSEGCGKSLCGRHTERCSRCLQIFCDTSSAESCFRCHEKACSMVPNRTDSADGPSDRPPNRFAGYTGKQAAAGHGGSAGGGGMA